MFPRPLTRRGAGEQPSPERPGPDIRPLVARTSGSAAQGVYWLILALSVIAVTGEYELSAGSVALAVLVTAIVFWLAHVYAHVLGDGVSH